MREVVTSEWQCSTNSSNPSEDFNLAMARAISLPDISVKAFPFVPGRRPFQFHEDCTFPHPGLYSLPFNIVLHIGIDVKRRVQNINVQNMRHVALVGALRVRFSWRRLPRCRERWHDGRIRRLRCLRTQSPQSFDIVSHSLQLELLIRKHLFLLIQIVLMFLDLFQVLPAPVSPKFSVSAVSNSSC